MRNYQNLDSQKKKLLPYYKIYNKAEHRESFVATLKEAQIATQKLAGKLEAYPLYWFTRVRKI